MSHIDWNKLVDTGRAKAIGISWSEEELIARYTHKIPAEYVREGVLTSEDYTRALQEVDKEVIKNKKKPIRYMTKAELLQEAQSCGVEHSPEMTRGDLILAIKESQEKKEKVS